MVPRIPNRIYLAGAKYFFDSGCHNGIGNSAMSVPITVIAAVIKTDLHILSNPIIYFHEANVNSTGSNETLPV